LKNNDSRTKYLENLIKNQLGPDDTFAFKCNACGCCCRNREDVLLSPHDLYRISKHLSIKPQEAFERYCETYIGQTSNIPVVRLKPKPVPNLLLRNPLPYSSVCPLLSDGRCSVHKSKPVTCALFPLGRMYNPQTKKVSYVLNNGKCGDKSEKQTVKDWLAEFSIPVYDKVFILWNEFLTETVMKMKKLKKMPDKAKELFYSCFFFAVYLAYDINEEFLPQLEKNIAKFQKLMDTMPSN